MTKRSFLAAALCCCQFPFLLAAEEPANLLPRSLPPVGSKITAAEETALRTQLDSLTQQLRGLPVKKDNANAEVFLKAVRYALDLREFYKPGDAKKAAELLSEAAARITALKEGRAPWLTAGGLVVRGYYSQVDGSAQPYGLDIAPDAPAANAPAWIWLHGRGDTTTDLHFIHERMKKQGQFHPPGTVVVHPFGRFCNGYKSAGGRDVIDVTGILSREKKIDPRRTVLAGFSMGGAGAWLLGAQYPDKWAAVHTGAGFVDVRRYQNLTDEKVAALPPWEVTLWGLNDVPGMVRNLLNTPVISYSGEKDKQRASAEIMAEEFQKQGAALPHLIGPGMEHKYHPDVAADIERKITAILAEKRPPYPLKLSLQTRTLAHARLHWLQLTGLEEHWKEARCDARIDALIPTAQRVEITTQNVTSLRLEDPAGGNFRGSLTVKIDGQELTGGGSGKAVLLQRNNGKWSLGPGAESRGLVKKPGLQGPIDDAFNASFLYVLPDKPCASPAVQAWMETEEALQSARWRWLMRGDVRRKTASQVTAEDRQRYHLILWGDSTGNSLIAEVLPRLPLKWDAAGVHAAGKDYPGAVPVCIYPNPLNPARYIVLNSGLTFREAHSKTNSLQNPKLPDWAVLDITRPADDTAPGKVLAAGFFNESWQLK